MRLAVAIVLVPAILACAAEEPVPLLRPVLPKANSVRVRIATSDAKESFYHFSARVPKKKGGMMDATVAFEVRPGQSFVTAKKWTSWGYDIPAKKVGVLPELVIPATQLAPKSSQGNEVDVRIPGIRLQIIEPPMGSATVLGCDLLLSMSDVTKNTDRAYQPRLYFADQVFELTAPAGAVKRSSGSARPPAEAARTADSMLVPVMAPFTTRGMALLSYAAINGRPRYQTADGKEVPVNMTISSTTKCPGGIILSMGAARGCGVVLAGKEIKGTGTNFETAIAEGTVKELRIGLQTGPGFKTPCDLVVKNVTVWVDKNDSGHMIWIGPEFLRKQFVDPVYACGADGAWKLYGRLKPEVLQDIKTRKK